ncbi:MAG TPA: SPFH domain-containing protein [Gemmatimonadaceae bacterium]|nr:SPFH domain-containing protein [Gemmatimonadaceae bacterium]
MLREKELKATSGMFALMTGLAVLALAVLGFVRGGQSESPAIIIASSVVMLVAIIMMAGLFTVNPNDAKVLTLFGRYIGTVREAGLWFANPFYAKKRISLRVRNFETTKLKVNDNHSNPIEIAAVVVWRVVDSAEALFEVDDYQHFVQTQSESAVRALAQSYPYDAHLVEEIALSTHPAEVAKGLQTAIQERLEKAGVNVIEARISHLAYAPEIASAMLRRQQASAIIAARRKIVEGAVGMVENALELISQKSIVTLDDERKAAMVSNLLVVLCSDRDAQPIVNTGTIYQ